MKIDEIEKYNKQIYINAIASVTQTVLISILAFILYSFLPILLGVEKVGLWSLVLSFTSIISLGNLGFSGSLVKISAELSQLGEHRKISNILNVVVLLSAAILLPLITIIHFCSHFLLQHLVERKWFATAELLIPFSLLSFFLNIISGLFLSVLEGLNKSFLKSIVFTFSFFIYVLLSYFLILKFDIIGLAYAQLIQSVVMLLSSIASVLVFFREYKLYAIKWEKDIMREVISYSANFQAISIVSMLFDPITKMFLSKYGTLTDVGYFEIASRIVSQLRGMVVGAMQSIVPKVAIMSKLYDKTRMASIHTILFRMNNFMIFAFIGAAVIFAPLLSQIFLKKIDTQFIQFLLSLSIAWGINSFNIPAYLINLGTGEIKGNLWSHIIVAILNILLCLSGGYFMGVSGVFIGFCGALVIGSSYILADFCVRYEYNVLKEFANIILVGPFLLLFIFYFVLSPFTNVLFLILCFTIFLLAICYFNRNEVFVGKVKSLLKL